MNWTDFLSAQKKLDLNAGKLKADRTYIGIDFGTSTTVVSVAFIDESGELIVNHLPLKQKLFNGSTATDYRINSAVACYNKKILVGKGAKELAPRLKRNENYWQSFKMELGTDKGVAYPNSEYKSIKNPQDVAVLFFRGLKNSIDSYIKDNNLPEEVRYTVTIPASFESNQRLDLIACLKKANISVEESGLIDEPNAAFLSYILDSEKNRNKLHIPEEFNPVVLVFDFGAGTCDISILEIGESHNGLFTRNISISQYSEIGGDNIDRRIAERYLLPQFFAQSNIKRGDLRKKEIEHEILPHLLPFAEKLKIAASERIAVYPEITELPVNQLIEQNFSISKLKRFQTRIGELHIDTPSINLQQFIDVSMLILKISIYKSTLFFPL
jgi:molecular chaperone DnaK (HSP70)